MWGSRESKYAQLWDGAPDTLSGTDVFPERAPWRFKPADAMIEALYLQGFAVAELFSPNGRPAPGIVTTQDEFAISWDPVDAASKVERLLQTENEAEAKKLFRLCSTTQWNYRNAKTELARGSWRELVRPISYRPFDTRWTVYDSHVAVHRRARVMDHFVGHENLGLATARSNKNPTTDHFLVSDKISETKFAESSTQSVVFPLYLYPESGSLETGRRVNFDPKIYAAIRAAAGLSQSSPERGGGSPLGLTEGPVPPRRIDAVENDPSTTRQGASGPPPRSGEDLGDELRVFDYIYGVLHSPDYRRTYAQFLKIDFPRIPYPASPAVFAHVADKGGQLRRLHLMEDAAVGDTPYPFVGPEDGSGDGVVGKVVFLSSPHVGEDKGGGPAASAAEKTAPLPEGQSLSAADAAGPHPDPPHKGEGRVHINADQYFDAVPDIAWTFHIGGYQPAQKWLKDRKGRALTFDDVRHYQRIIKILVETDRIMKEIVLPLD